MVNLLIAAWFAKATIVLGGLGPDRAARQAGHQLVHNPVERLQRALDGLHGSQAKPETRAGRRVRRRDPAPIYFAQADIDPEGRATEAEDGHVLHGYTQLTLRIALQTVQATAACTQPMGLRERLEICDLAVGYDARAREQYSAREP